MFSSSMPHIITAISLLCNVSKYNQNIHQLLSTSFHVTSENFIEKTWIDWGSVAVMQTLYSYVTLKRELSQKKKLLLYESMLTHAVGSDLKN